jgi:hypothetical protein
MVVYPFVAVILVCLNSVMPWACNEKTAVDVLSNGVESELSCVMGWQDVIARSALAQQVGKTVYVKTLCRRSGAETGQPRTR